MSKQDGTAPRTAADLERKYNFGQSFAEVYGLVEEAKRTAEEAKQTVGELDQEKIFNLLTNFGQNEGVYRDENGELYVHASYIKSGELKGENLKVDAATINGKLIATQVDIKDLEVNAAKVVGKLTAAEIDAGKITGGELDFSVVTAKNLTIGSLGDDGTYVKKENMTSIVGGIVTTEYVNALGITVENVLATELESTGDNDFETVNISGGMIDFYNGGIYSAKYDEFHVFASRDLVIKGDDIRLEPNGGSVFIYFKGGGGYEFANDGIWALDSNNNRTAEFD